MAAPTSSAPGEFPARILVRGVNWLGDAVMTTPALQRLRARFPAAHLALLTPAKLEALWQHHPSLDQVIAVEPDAGVWAVGRRLRTERFQLALVLPNSARSALECWLGRVPRRVGYSHAGRDWFLSQVVPARPGRVRMRKRSPREIRQLVRAPSPSVVPGPAAHQIHDYLHLAATLGADPAPLPPLVAVTAAEIEQARRTWLPEALRPDERPCLGLNPGAEYGPAKRWPAASFVAAARSVSARVGPCRWLIFGAAHDAPLCGEIAAGMGDTALNLAGRTSLRELMGLLRSCRVLLTNDTGPMHLAAALGTPVVVPFGSTSAALTGPGLPGDPRHRLLSAGAACSPCFLRACPIDFRCLNGLSPELVAAAVLAAME